MSDDETVRFYKENREYIDIAKEHGELVVKSMAKAIERLAKKRDKQV